MRCDVRRTTTPPRPKWIIADEPPDSTACANGARSDLGWLRHLLREGKSRPSVFPRNADCYSGYGRIKPEDNNIQRRIPVSAPPVGNHLSFDPRPGRNRTRRSRFDSGGTRWIVLRLRACSGENPSRRGSFQNNRKPVRRLPRHTIMYKLWSQSNGRHTDGTSLEKCTNEETRLPDNQAPSWHN